MKPVQMPMPSTRNLTKAQRQQLADDIAAFTKNVFKITLDESGDPGKANFTFFFESENEKEAMREAFGRVADTGISKKEFLRRVCAQHRRNIAAHIDTLAQSLATS